MEVGIQFLDDATEQYNHESELRADPEHPGVAMGQVISDATLEAANQSDFPVPISAALASEQTEVMLEPEAHQVDLRSRAIIGASLFDRPAPAADDPALAEELEQRQAEEDFSLNVAEPLQQAEFISDDPSDVDEARQQEMQRLLDERVKRRLRVDVLPKERADARRRD